ncbi:MAG TPA: hypothetical protein VLI90_10360 [Tepidisphaeraceae bacterium]|nr:hypothetical protein [Tepidisphaeraceae bacterium]
MAANQSRPLRLIFNPAKELAARLTQLEAARTDLLADDEYASWRSSMLSEITGRPRMPRSRQITLALCGIACVGLLVLGVFRQSRDAIIGGAAGLIGAALLWFTFAYQYSVMGHLDRDNRLSVIDRLVEMRLVAEPEAADLRAKVRSAFPAQAGTLD